MEEKMEKKDVDALAILLEKVGYDNPEKLIEKELIPLAIKESWSLRKALNKYADAYLGEKTNWHQLRIALNHISSADLNVLAINEVVIKKPPWL